MRQPVVDVVVIGAMKCGTTAIYHFFKTNKVFAVNKGKEVNFFLEEYDEISLAAYDKTFLPGQIRVDVSPNYSKRHQYRTAIAKEIFRANPNAKIIFLVRDPLKRIESHLYHNLLRDRLDKKRLTDMRYLQNYVLTSSYLFQIQVYLDHFRRNNILVLQQELMKKQPSRFIEALSIFLETPMTQKTIDNYYTGEQKYLIPGFDLVRKVMGAKFMFNLYNPFWSFVKIQPKPVCLDEKTKDAIRNQLAEDAHAFCGQFGLEKSWWHYFFEGEPVKD